MIRNILKKTGEKTGIIKKDCTHEYWESVAKKELPKVMTRISTDFTPKDFAEKQESIIFDLNIKFNKSQTVLDLACGLGRTCKWVAPQVYNYIGVDFVQDMILKAKKYNEQFKNADFIKNNGYDLRTIIPDETIDIAYCELAFQHIPKYCQETYVNDLAKILKPNGKFYVQIPKIKVYKRKETSSTKEEVADLFKDWNYEESEIYPSYYTVIATPKRP